MDEPEKERPPVAQGEREPSFFERLKKAPITVALTVINIAMFTWAETHGGTTNNGTLLEYGAVEPLHVWAGEYWRVATSMFMHIGVVHILVNTYASFGWSTTLEAALGKARFLALYLLAGIAAGCASVIYGILYPPHLSAGASGAMFGIIGATLILRRRRLPSTKAFLADKPVRSTLVQIAIWTAIGTQLHFDNAAHMGGLVAGGVLAWLFSSPSRRVPIAGWGLFAVGFVMIFFVATQPWGPPRDPEHPDAIGGYAKAYLTGKTGKSAWPVNISRGVAFATKGCNSGVAYACVVLADYDDKIGELASKSSALRERACKLEPKDCIAEPTEPSDP